MRKFTPASLATAVVLALAAGAALAQTAPRPPMPASSTAATNSVPRASATTTRTGASGGSGSMTPAATGPVAVAAPGGDLTPSGSGQTYSAIGPTPGSTSGTGTGSTSGLGATGTTTGVPLTPGTSTTRTVNADGTTTVTTSSSQGWMMETFDRNGMLIAKTDSRSSPFAAPVINGTPAGVTADGERLREEERAAAGMAAPLVELQERAMLNADLARSSVSLNRVIRDAEKDRRKIGRNGQLLHTIAPRTDGVDRSHEMPDDGPTPALSGLASGFARR